MLYACALLSSFAFWAASWVHGVKDSLCFADDPESVECKISASARQASYRVLPVLILQVALPLCSCTLNFLVVMHSSFHHACFTSAYAQ